MRLTTIKLAGFKSFVDPTTLHLPTNMSAVVGPNGCGKSNIIDAVRWVMGESAASRLRGDSLTDVIFSGSSARKPVGQAVVELIFDNSDGTVTGEYAHYNEISVKRLVSRDGQSQYFLNGTRCRRRDITDLFLGTGLGPRSYSIIEQGMISQIIESDPEQLRVHLEEAAGISRYKERRKETESRIKATRENLDRVKDVRDEVDKQLEHLKRQARAAERWQALQDQRKRREAELKAANLRDSRADLEERSAALRQAELGIEEQLAVQRQREAQIETGREAHAGASEHLNGVQAEVYKVGAEIARVEQQIQHNRALAEQLERARVESANAQKELAEHIANDAAQMQVLVQGLDESAPQREALSKAAQQAAEALQVAETNLAQWQEQWDAYAKANSEASQAAEIERTRLDYLDRQCLDVDKRRQALETERGTANLADLAQAFELLDGEHVQLRDKTGVLATQLESRRSAFESQLESARRLQASLSEKRSELEKSRGRLASLEALQHAALGGEAGTAHEWLERLGLGRSRRLAEVLEVDVGWEAAVETVLQGWLDAVLVDSPSAFETELHALEQVNLTLLSATSSDTGFPAGTLAAKARGPVAALNLLARVTTVESIGAAQSAMPMLGDGQSLITPEGEWIGPGFARIARSQGAQAGVLSREREISGLSERIAELESEISALVTQQEDARLARIEAEQARDDAQRDLHAGHRRLAEIAGQLQSQRGRMDSARERLAKVEVELTELAAKLEADRQQAREARGRLDGAVHSMGELEQRRQHLDADRRSLLEGREEARMNAREAHDAEHRAALSIESKRSAMASLEQSLARMRAQLGQVETRQAEIAAQIAAGGDPLAELEALRQSSLNQRLLVDKQLVEARKALEERDAEMRALESERNAIVEALTERREHLANLRLSDQEHRLQAQALADAIIEAGFEIDALLAELPEHVEAGQWRQDLLDLEQKIHRLEPVNLAAIKEYEEQSQRKTYLDAQLTDLGVALETLESAIRKIDRETRQRFKDTFDRVNQGVQELFPRLFGGGQAYLELTGDDLLSTGVSIMARPPGKRVTSISLLSGGEKAMTAVALVFSIFRLNPAPFCLLDEVDAPLDEANVGRFSALVSEMSQNVQFIFVTHNKATMEAASQLCGVTMREPGVSRLVQVDLAEAAKLAGAA
ncbi:MAG TPA: chromosome segregation protein SMC [Dokdonella sp.]|uniref:chromosome segregation protein SMC n=1 Tax=Dokdonella sp. TaxID=2291710 RepID=UPI002B771B06|nr:chromosome segregation protein SMC [Dokdonella sp.]HNV08805.1 chromosome segregation protein SMC [Dokdonella sp.]HPW02844.1 chromosome segregation protein SMC [Dokdonella sp.]